MMSESLNLDKLYFQVDVNGPSTAPIYQFLKSESGGFLGDFIKWNFEKFLVDKKGRVVERYPPTTSPFQIEVRNLNYVVPGSSWFSVSGLYHEPNDLDYLTVYRQPIHS